LLEVDITFFFCIFEVPGYVVLCYLNYPEPPDAVILLIKMVLLCGIGFYGLLPRWLFEKELCVFYRAAITDILLFLVFNLPPIPDFCAVFREFWVYYYD